MKISKRTKRTLIISSVIILIIAWASLVYFLIPKCCCGSEIVPLEYGKEAGITNEFKVTITNLGGLSDRIKFINITNQFFPSQLIINEEIPEFKYIIESGLNYTIVFMIQDSFTIGGDYSLEIIYQTRGSCDRRWNGYKTMTLDFAY